METYLSRMNLLNHKLNVARIIEDFPVLKREVSPNIPLVYLDSTATSQKPTQVLVAMDRFLRENNANIHRGIHTLAEESTALYEEARQKISKFINSPSAKQIIFTRNTTESINLVVQSWGRKYLEKDDIVILTEMEHHSNLVPWQMLASEKKIQLEFIPVTDDGFLDLSVYDNLLNQNPKFVAFTHMSNVLGTINPAKEIIKKAHDNGALVLLDAAQSVPHFPVDVTDINADFLAFSAHKMCGPTGIGILYGRKDLLDTMPPFLGGGDMIKRVYLRSFFPNEVPYKFEAGTPAIAEVIGFGAAVDYLSEIGMDQIADYEHELIEYAIERLEEVPGVTILGPEARYRGGVASFTIDGIHPHDIAQILDMHGIAIRAGHHCAMPLHDKYHIPASARASFYLYNMKSEIDLLINALYEVRKIFG